MVEKIKHISNPLTIIAIFSALAEVAGAVTLPFVNTELQKFFIWYVMGLPVLLVILFFLTLNFNPKVLYSPSDFENEDNFMKAVINQVKVDSIYNSIENEFKSIKHDINDISKQTDSKELFDELNNKLDGLNKLIQENKNDVNNEISISQKNAITTNSALQAKIYSYLITSGEQNIDAIVSELKMSKTSVLKSVDRLIEKGFVEKQGDSKNIRYFVKVKS